jgi:hypothetical protein
MTMASGNVHLRDDEFVKHSSVTLGVGVFYHGRLAVIKGVHFVNSRAVVEIQATVNQLVKE